MATYFYARLFKNFFNYNDNIVYKGPDTTHDVVRLNQDQQQNQQQAVGEPSTTSSGFIVPKSTARKFQGYNWKTNSTQNLTIDWIPINFPLNDGLSTTITILTTGLSGVNINMTNFDMLKDSYKANEFNYCVIYTSSVSNTTSQSSLREHSFWYITDVKYANGATLQFVLQRDVLNDCKEQYIQAPAYIERAMLDATDPLIANPEGNQYNQIKSDEILLKNTEQDYYAVYLENTNRQAVSDGSFVADYGNIIDADPDNWYWSYFLTEAADDNRTGKIYFFNPKTWRIQLTAITSPTASNPFNYYMCWDDNHNEATGRTLYGNEYFGSQQGQQAIAPTLNSKQWYWQAAVSPTTIQNIYNNYLKSQHNFSYNLETSMNTYISTRATPKTGENLDGKSMLLIENQNTFNEFINLDGEILHFTSNASEVGGTANTQFSQALTAKAGYYRIHITKKETQNTANILDSVYSYNALSRTDRSTNRIDGEINGLGKLLFEATYAATDRIEWYRSNQGITANFWTPSSWTSTASQEHGNPNDQRTNGFLDNASFADISTPTRATLSDPLTWNDTFNSVYRAIAIYNDFDGYEFELEWLGDSLGSTVNYTIPSSSDSEHPVDAPYDIMLVPTQGNIAYKHTDGTVSYYPIDENAATAFITSLPKKLGSALYDIQRVPYYSVVSDIKEHIDQQGNTEHIPMIRANANYTNLYSVFDSLEPHYIAYQFVKYASFNGSITLDTPLEYPKNYFVDDTVNDNVNAKIQHETQIARLCSPNYTGIFEFSIAANNGLTGFEYNCTYKPFSPYIHINPIWGWLNGSDWNDQRGLVCGGDFSMPIINNAWTEYQLQNKNYEKTFQRGIQNMRKIGAIDLTKEAVASIFNVQTAFANGNSSIGSMLATDFGTKSASNAAIGGMADLLLDKAKLDENVKYQKDVHKLELGNIQAMPETLSRVSAFDIDNKHFPFLEIYEATSREQEVLRATIQLNSMNVGTVGKINEFLETDFTFIKGHLLFAALPELTVVNASNEYFEFDPESFIANPKIMNEINNKLQKGILIK